MQKHSPGAMINNGGLNEATMTQTAAPTRCAPKLRSVSESLANGARRTKGQDRDAEHDLVKRTRSKYQRNKDFARASIRPSNHHTTSRNECARHWLTESTEMSPWQPDVVMHPTMLKKSMWAVSKWWQIGGRRRTGRQRRRCSMIFKWKHAPGK